MSKMAFTSAFAFAFAALGAAAGSVQAGNLITNGDFETGDFTGWTANVQSGSNGNLFVVTNNGGNSPLSGYSYASNPSGGAYFALTDQYGPGSYSLTQSFTVGSPEAVNVSFDFFANNYASDTFPGRDHTDYRAQNAEVDILTGSADPFTNGPGIFATLYGPNADSSSNPNPWTYYSETLYLAAGTYQIRFAETDNQYYFNMGVDNVSVSAAGVPGAGTVPEPSTWMMMLAGFSGLSFAGHRARRAAISLVSI